VLDMAEAIRDNRPQRISCAQAAHVVEVVSTMHQAFRDGCRVGITSDFPQPAPMEWADQRVLSPSCSDTGAHHPLTPNGDASFALTAKSRRKDASP
jgi:hypothetical protein